MSGGSWRVWDGRNRDDDGVREWRVNDVGGPNRGVSKVTCYLAAKVLAKHACAM